LSPGARSVCTVTMKRVGGFGLFDPARGGDPVLSSTCSGSTRTRRLHHDPACHGRDLETVCAFSRKNLVRHKGIAMSSLGIAFVGSSPGVTHVRRRPEHLNAGGSASSPCSWRLHRHQGLQLGGTMYRGAISFKTPFAYIADSLLLVFAG